MGYYLNNKDAYYKYREVLDGRYFVDKSSIFEEILPLLKEPSLGYVYRLSANSERMLKATKADDTAVMAEILEYAT